MRLNNTLTPPNQVGPVASLAGAYVASLMRRNKVTIRALANRMNITKKRIREVVKQGVSGPCMCNDWFEAITKTGLFPEPKGPPATKADMARIKVFSGYVCLDGVRVQVDFQAPANATKEQLDSAFLDVLAQKAEIDYLEIGEI